MGRNRARSGFALAAIATGVTALILAGGFVHDLIYRLGEAVIHSQSGHIQLARAGYFTVGSRAPSKYLMSPDDVRRLDLSDVPEVSHWMRRISFAGLLSNGRANYPVVGEGIEADQEARLGSYMVVQKGRALSSKDRYAALVGEGVARAMNLRPGSTISVTAPTVDEVMNALDLEVVGVFQSFSKDYDDRVIKVPLNAAQELINTDGVNIIVLALNDTQATAKVARSLNDRTKDLGLEVKTWDTLNDFYWKTVALYDRQFGALRFIVLVMVMLAVAGTINMAVFERAGEFGTMRALGNRASDVMKLVVFEAAVMGLVGAIVGVSLALALAWLISAIGIPMPPPPNSNLTYVASVQVVQAVVVGAFLVGVGATVLASILPGLRVSRMPIAEALRRVK